MTTSPSRSVRRASAPAMLTTCFALLASTACPDPCVFLGGGCNDNDDCAADQVCRKARDYEGLGCSLVEGRCIDIDNDDKVTAGGRVCGSVDDCEDGECCDPITDTCVGELSYLSLNCDEHTCRDCNDTDFGDRCQFNDECDDDEACTANDINGFGTIEENGICRLACNDDDECGAFESCNSSVCTVPIGTACALPGDTSDDVSFSDDDCLGLNCTRLDANNERIDEPYCTDLCFEPGECPPGLVCFEADNECRRP
jgi:hypothetical protein